ncbi:hypothetical protein M2451_003724 [Dysgonomonas sp. PFB1-18]|uniref:hypothetical protein n=1 Tax=unclassified Dysgonomonas TaxID=2630389 RepID=UPI0024735FE5|nr:MULTISPECIES: hypothetical protein [unclassified Dysgonomonas]MDH6310452.1 hypothetical protein [Dysgonomonas sp. PF1-14]MDH6340763.1 hypothetical protein [Dysgonomonas sp. PF1-16]MDH6382383.1 hypothetical protein [Dysgonomonas sp. PFB1-18]MDH6399716.1 hypothetical protein [Dysgonomonas sp. PF1-23]
MRTILYPYIFLLAIAFASCESMDFDDPSTLTNEEAATKIKTFSYSLTTSSVQTTFNTTTSAAGVHFSLLADQTTNTNGNGSWWDYAKEPRVRIVNNSAARGYAATLTPFYNNFYQANLDATKVIDLIENQNIKAYDDAGNDRTTDCLIGAYYAKGVSQGYLGVIYDRGIIVDNTSVKEAAFPDSYKDLIANGIALIDKSIALAEASSDFNFDFLIETPIDKEQFVRLANSIAARILSSQARDKAEAQALGENHWKRVLAYAEKGLTSDFLISTVPGGYYNALVDRLVYLYSGGAYLPVDIKVAYLADNTGNYPNYYPAAPTILGPVETDDKRFHEYFEYTTNFGILLEARGRGLFSNYKRKRWANNSNNLNVPGAINPYFLTEELRLLRAESKFCLKDYTGAAAELNAPDASRKAKGLLPDVAATEDALRKALHYEYAVEIDGAGGAFVPFTFMRRNDLLIGGTPTEYPIPQKQLELIRADLYSFGGIEHAGETGIYGELATARDNGWKPSE